MSVGERNLLGTGQAVRAALQYGQRSRGVELSYVQPYLFDTRLAMGVDFFDKQTNASSYQSYASSIYGGNLRFGVPLTDTLVGSVRYSIYRQKITLPSQLNNCNNVNPDFLNTFPTPDKFFQFAQQYVNAGNPLQTSCYQDGEAALPIKMELNQGPVVVSLIGYGLTYNTLDNTRSPTSGLLIDAKQDVAGIGGDVNFIKNTVDLRLYQEVYPDIIGTLRFQAGYMSGWDGQSVRVLDAFQGGPNLVRGFAPAGLVRATSRPAPTTTRSAAPSTGQRRLNSRRRCSSRPKTSACGSRPLRTPACCGASTRRPSIRPPRSAWSSPTAPRSGPRSASDSSGIRRSVRCASIWPMRHA